MTHGPLATNFSEIQNKIQQFYRWKFIRKCYLQACFVNSSSPSAAYLYVNWISIVSGNGLLPIQCQAITWKHFIPENAFENVMCEMAAILSRGRWVNCMKRTVVCRLLCLLDGSGSPQFMIWPDEQTFVALGVINSEWPEMPARHTLVLLSALFTPQMLLHVIF